MAIHTYCEDAPERIPHCATVLELRALPESFPKNFQKKASRIRRLILRRSYHIEQRRIWPHTSRIIKSAYHWLSKVYRNVLGAYGGRRVADWV
jgi:hypothetical protein